MLESNQNPEEDNKSILDGSKKTSVLLPPDVLEMMCESPMNQTQTIVAALRFYFSDAREKIAEYPRIISGYEKNIVEYEKNIAVLEAKVSESDFIKQEFARLHDLLDEQRKLSQGHMAQVQSLIEAGKSQEYIIRQKEDKILQLEEARSIPRKKWFQFWK